MDHAASDPECANRWRFDAHAHSGYRQGKDAATLRHHPQQVIAGAGRQDRLAHNCSCRYCDPTECRPLKPSTGTLIRRGYEPSPGLGAEALSL